MLDFSTLRLYILVLGPTALLQRCHMVSYLQASLIAVLSLFTIASARPAKDYVMGPVAVTGGEAVRAQAYLRVPGVTLDDEGGTPNSTYEIVGQTWFDIQTNGTHGKQIAVDPLGAVHFAWTNGEDAQSSSRHVFYNCWYQDTLAQGPTGVTVESSNRAGFCNIAAAANGFAFPAFHQALLSTPHAAASIDFIARAGAYTAFEVPFGGHEPAIIWPHIDMDRHGRIHMVATESGGAAEEYYVRGQPSYDSGFGIDINWGAGFVTPWDPATFITIDVACSRQSDRVAVAWIADPAGDIDQENIQMRVSEDGGNNWSDIVEVTGIPPIDPNCMANGGDYITCNADTFRPWIDLSLILDDDDNVHIAYTAHAWYYFDEDGTVGPFGLVYSTIWHWGEDREEFNLINHAFFANDSVALGVNNLMCHRPSLAIDTTNGYLYCSFQQFDQHAFSDAGYPMGEFYISVSTDNGQTWAIPTNVSNTPGQPNQPTGNDPSERDITIAKYVTDGVIHALYQHDYAAGSAVAGSGAEGPATLNDMVYMRVPVSDIPTHPLQEIWAFRADSTGFPRELSSRGEHVVLPAEMLLHQNYPNPFNPMTNIQFDLAKAGSVKLAVYDVTGRQVATLLDEAMSAGAHVVTFDGSSFTTGVYFARLESGGESMTKKMILLK